MHASDADVPPHSGPLRRASFARFAWALGALALAGCEHPANTGGPAATLAKVEPAADWVTPTNQRLTPTGKQVALNGMRPQMLALSPDGKLLAVGGLGLDVVIVDPVTGAVRQRPALPKGSIEGSESEASNLTQSKADKPSLAGLVFSPDGSRLFCSNANGSVKVFAVDAAGNVTPAADFPLPRANAPTRRAEVPAGMAISADGRRLYVVADLSNQLLELDSGNGKVLRQWPVGVAPLDVVLTGGKAYVSNQGGERPDDAAVKGPAGRGTFVRVDDRSIANRGSVSAIDFATGKVTEIPTGPHASDLAVSPDGRYVVVANAGEDTLSVIDTRTDKVTEKIWARQSPHELFGAQPCALAFDPSGERLYVCNGTQNAVAVVEFEPAHNTSRVVGLVPVGWFPAAIVYDRVHRQLCAANMKGFGITPGEDGKYKTIQYHGTVSLFAPPSTRELATMTETTQANNRALQLRDAMLPPRPGQPARPVPERTGEPSVFKHVIYIIKENRSYDQMLGDMKEGNGDAALCTFGENVTPNQHAIARQFVLLDNTYCAGVQSSDGHQWATSAFANDYIERQLTAGHPRSYPGSKGDPDALAYAASGFIWDNVLSHGRTFRNYGEWMVSDSGWADHSRKGKPTWADFMNDRKNGTHLTRVASKPQIEALGRHSETGTVGWEQRVPDQIRADKFIADLQRHEREDNLPDFVMLFLPNDHTSATRAGYPTPSAYVADNDLAVGRIVEALSHSKFWRDTCLFAIEDDPQNGWDHVSGYRTTCYVVSAYTKRGVTISTPYNQPGVMRTMELMLGLPPMNQLDATATPLTGCFMDNPDFAPYTAVPNRVSLEELNPNLKHITDARQRKDALASARLRLDAPDLADEGELNRILWHAQKGHDAPFPAWAVKLGDDD